MRWLGRTDFRVILAILLTALIPLLGSVLIARAIVARISATAFQPEFGHHIDQALTVYADLAKSMKEGLRHETLALASSGAMRDARFFQNASYRDETLASLGKARNHLVSLRVETCSLSLAGSWAREGELDASVERPFTVRVLLSPGNDPVLVDNETPEPSCTEASVPYRFEATFAVARARFDELEGATSFAQAYHEVERNHREEYLDATYRNLFAVLLAITMVIGGTVGIVVATPVTSGIAALARATRPVAEGDLSVRVSVRGKGEVAGLGRAFNHMLEELEQSRARVEFLRRVGEWQKVARRLAHEIKNPLTPILLAVEECHRRYSGDDLEYTKILETTLEVVGEEVASLRRLVTEFSGFARLPRATLVSGDLAKVLLDERSHFSAVIEGAERASFDDGALFANVRVAFDVPDKKMPAIFDREMIHRALGNVIKNAAQALRDARGSRAELAVSPLGNIRVTAKTEGDSHVLCIDDDGPGIPKEVRTTLFDPYVTTKRDGTGLGLTIVKKIIVDHGGTIEVQDSPEGGARIRVSIPKEGSASSVAAMEKSKVDDEGAPFSG